MSEDLDLADDPAPPVARPAERAAEPVHGTNGVHPLDAADPEVALVAAICGDPGMTNWHHHSHIPPEAFTNLEARGIWAALRGGTMVDDPEAMLRDCRLTIPRYSEWQTLDTIGTFASIHAGQVMRAYRERRKGEIALEMTRRPEVPPEVWAKRLEDISEDTGHRLPSARGFSAFSYPTADDPTVLLGSDDYLCRGGGMLFISHAGAGKSSWIYDAVMSWGLGRRWMGIRSHGPLKTLVIQAEDSDRYIGKIAGSYKHINRLTPEELAQLDVNFVMAEVRGVFGTEFLSVLRGLVAKHKPDLVVINPIYLYADGDISKGEVVQRFLAGLDSINVEKKFGYILVHHTGKPAKKEGGKPKAVIEDWESAYMGIGSSFWANWPRCSALLEPVAGKAGKFLLRLGKGGMNAGVTKRVDQGTGWRDDLTTKVSMKHTKEEIEINGHKKPCVYWEEDVDIPEETGDEKGEKSKDRIGRPMKYEFSDYKGSFPGPGEKPVGFAQILRRAGDVLTSTGKAISKDALKRLMHESKGQGYIVETGGIRGLEYRLAPFFEPDPADPD